MPVTGSNSGPEKGPGGGGRTTFRPPWVKEGPQSSSTTAAPWTKRNEGTSKENGQPAVKESKLQSREIKVPIMTTKPKPVQAPLKPKEEKPEKIEKEQVLETKKDFTLEKPKLRHVDTNNKEKKVAQTELLETPKLRPVLKKTTKVDEVKQPIERKLSSADKTAPKNSDNASSVPAPPPPPPPTNIPRAPPPPPGLKPPEDFEKTPLSDKQKDNLDKLKQRARRRPDWSEMMKEVEDGRKLRHVKCNDRSNPILTSKSLAKVSGQFVYETEKANIHNQLLHQIQSGICLKPTRCNDRSKPILEGLRKFRRQMTIEEQIQKSESRAVLNEEDPEEESEDEMDDIDKLRDDLQSTKQMLALEMRNKEAQERENKRLLSKIANLEAELKREKTKAPSGNSTTETISTGDEALVTSLKKDAEEARKTCKDLEKKYQQSAEQLDTAKSDIEEQKRQIATLEKRLSQAAQGGGVVDARRPSEPGQKESSPEPELEESESDSDDDDEKKAERLERRLGREVKMLVNKLQKLKDKQQAAQKERTNLKEAMKKNQLLLKEENKKFKKLQKEVDKMAAMMKDDEDDDEEKEDDEEEEEEEDEESETEEETETEDSEDESGSETESESEEEDASNEDKKSNLEPRVKRHEGRLTALKKGNYLLQANVERIQDEINKIREKSVTLQRDLDSVLSELG